MSAAWLDEVRNHASCTAAHYIGNDQFSSQSLTSTVHGLETLWTPADKSAFFRAVAVHSRLRPDLIAAELRDKKVWEVCNYLNLLEEESQKVGPLKRLHPPPAAVEVSEAWIVQEERLAASVIEHEDSDVGMLGNIKNSLLDKSLMSRQRQKVLEKLDTPEQRALDRIIRVHEETVALQPLNLDKLIVMSPKPSPSRDDTASASMIKQPTTPPKPDANLVIDPTLEDMGLSGDVSSSVAKTLAQDHLGSVLPLSYPTWNFMSPPLPSPPSPSLRESFRSLYKPTSPYTPIQVPPSQQMHVPTEHPLPTQSQPRPAMSPGWLTRSSTHPLPDISLAFPSSRAPLLSPARSTLPVARSHTPPQSALHVSMLPPLSPLPYSYLDTFHADQSEGAPSIVTVEPPPRPEFLSLVEELPQKSESAQDPEATAPALLSPRSRRRHQKRLYMRRRRATARGEAAENILTHVGRLKPGRKCPNDDTEGRSPAELGQAQSSSLSLPLTTALKRSRSEASLEGSPIENLGIDVGRGDRPDGEVPDAKKHKKSGPTKDTKAMDTMQENGIDYLYLQQHGIDMFYLAMLGKLCSTYANIHESAAPALSGTLVISLCAALRGFVATLMENALMVGTLDRRSKSRTKAWRLQRWPKKGDITPQHVERALTVTQHAVLGGTEQFWQRWIDSALVHDNTHEDGAQEGDSASTPSLTPPGHGGGSESTSQPPIVSANEALRTVSNGQEYPLRETSDFCNFQPPLVQMPTMDPTFLSLFGIDCQWLDWRVPSRVEDPTIAEAWRMDESDLMTETSWELRQEDKLDDIDRERSEAVERALWIVHAGQQMPTTAMLMESDQDDVVSIASEDEESETPEEPSVADGDEEWFDDSSVLSDS